MRRLPIYFLIDVSESMIGEPIKCVEDGIKMIVEELKKDPYALDTVYISIIVFAGVARTLVPLTDIINFKSPRFSIGAGTSYSQALDHLIDDIGQNIVKTTATQKGDWKPIIYFMTDGNPTDDFEASMINWEQRFKSKTNIVAISIGDNCDNGILSRISNNVLTFDDSSPAAYKKFFKWVTGSIKTQSQKIETANNDGDLDLSAIDKEDVRRVSAKSSSSRRWTDERYAIFHGRCRNTRKDYLLKYIRTIKTRNMVDIPYDLTRYQLKGSYSLNADYQELSDPDYKIKRMISTNELSGFPACPCCNSQIAICICKCGRIFCVEGDGVYTCPWCHLQSNFGRGRSPLSIGRQLG